MFYGDLQVTILNETRSGEYVITEFKLAKVPRFFRIVVVSFEAPTGSLSIDKKFGKCLILFISNLIFDA